MHETFDLKRVYVLIANLGFVKTFAYGFMFLSVFRLELKQNKICLFGI